MPSPGFEPRPYGTPQSPSVTAIPDGFERNEHATQLSGLPEDFWLEFQAPVVAKASNKMFSDPLMCCYFCSFSLLLCAIAHNCGICDPAFLCDFELSLRAEVAHWSSKYTTGHKKCNTKKDQKYHSEIYLADNMLYKDGTIKITASCGVCMMTKSVVSVATIVAMPAAPRLGIESKRPWMLPWGTAIHAASTYLQSGSGVVVGGVSRANRCASLDHSISVGDRSGEQAGQ
ncbi:hypothetical protein TNCV_3586591 [Trichonephila clavipes]|nr:hypothetical protein TNCV_3586591 [Trichonephila clavipes]